MKKYSYKNLFVIGFFSFLSSNVYDAIKFSGELVGERSILNIVIAGICIGANALWYAYLNKSK